MLDDAAQAFGAGLASRKLGTFGDMTATSFFPAKPLGCYGDGGAVFTDDDALADLLRSLRMHGQGSDRYDNVRIGLASRLDTIQAAVLSEKLKIFPDEIAARNAIARRYDDGLRDVAIVPRVPAGAKLGLGAIHHPGDRRAARRPRRRAQGRGHPDARSITRSRCTGSRPTSTIRSATAASPSASAWRTR